MPDASFCLSVAFLMGTSLGVAGCGDARPAPPTIGEQASRRLVTLAPALTQMIVDIGRADLLVGVTDQDAAAPRGVAIVGNYVDLDAERLLASRPTHVLQMLPKGGISPGLTNLADQAGFVVVGYPYPRTVRDVADTLHGGMGESPSLGEIVENPERAAAVRGALLRYFSELEAMLAERGRTRALLVIGMNPLMGSGPGTVLDELLRYAGGENVAAGATVSAPTYDREALLAANPQVVLVLSPGRKAIDEQSASTLVPEFENLPVDAVRDGRIMLINDPAALLPSTSLPRIAGIMARALHPDMSGDIARLGAAYEEVLVKKEAGRDPSIR